jgi:hypothetical protein
MSGKQLNRPNRHRRRAGRTPVPVDLSKTPWGVYEVGAFFGGSKPLHPATVYRGIKEGRIPRPYHPSPGISRWEPDECHAARVRMIAERDGEQ